MKIEHYSFGKIIIDGRTYTSDLIIFPDRVNSHWWRKEGHFLQLDDLKEVITEIPEAIVIGTGYYGVMKISDEVISKLKSLKIDVHVARTTEAVTLFNELCKKRKTIACLHLTC